MVSSLFLLSRRKKLINDESFLRLHLYCVVIAKRREIESSVTLVDCCKMETIGIGLFVMQAKSLMQLWS